MTENIRQIGFFLIVAQTFMHFAAGKQYEKYMKIIAGIIVLLLFVRPFSASGEDFEKKWQREMTRLTQQIESHNDKWQRNLAEYGDGSGDAALRKIEEEIGQKLEREASTGEYDIADVTIIWGRDADRVPVVDCIRITLVQAASDDEMPGERSVVEPVVIEEVRTGIQTYPKEEQADKERQDDGTSQEEYRSIFAEILGLSRERVEVVIDGGR